MLTFSKRNPDLHFGGSYAYAIRRHRMGLPGVDRERSRDLIEKNLRIRLTQEVRYILSHENAFIEPFLLIKDQTLGRIYLDESSFGELFRREIGYDILEYFDPQNLLFIAEKTDAEEDVIKYSDKYLFDLIEVILIFALKERRADLVDRMNRIFLEENSNYSVGEFMITNKDQNSGLRSILPLLKDEVLKKKIGELYDTRRAAGSNHEVLASISADLLQFVFSSPENSSRTKSYSEDLCKKLAAKWTSKAQKETLSSLLNSAVKNAKELNNQISNIRHTDQHTIQLESPSLYKLIYEKNIAIVEMVVLTFPEEYIIKQDVESLKSDYINRYSIENRISILSSDDIDIADIPF